jgi:uncharacterized protein (DUF4415 family)
LSVIAIGKMMRLSESFLQEKQNPTKKSNMEHDMRKEYDFTNAKPNPYVKKLRKQISIRIDVDTIDYFKMKAEETGIAYQNLINLYLTDCAIHKKNVNIVWE